MSFVRNLTIRAKLLLALGTLSVLLLGTVGGGWLAVQSMRASISSIYVDRVVPLRDLKTVSDLYAVSIVDASHKVRNDNMTWAEGLKGVEAAKAGILKAWSAYLATVTEANEKAVADDAARLMREADKVVAKLVDILKAEERSALATFTVVDLYPAIDPVSEALTKLVEIQLDVAKAENDKAEWTFDELKIGFGTVLLLAIVALLLTARTVVGDVSRPLARLAGQMQGLAAGDLAIAVTDGGKRDEVGTLARALQVFKDALIAKQAADAAMAAEGTAKMRRAQRLDELTQRFEASVSALSGGLSSAASELQATAQSMSAIAGETTGQSVNVAGAAEQTSANVQTVAAATEELSISIREIATRVSESNAIAQRAVEKAKGTDQTVQALAVGASRIGDVVALISSVAAQTNLLALNATIEAARAGEAGRGFAVVASEVKALAGQTTRATEEISSQIAAIQHDTEQAVTAVREIGTIIGEISAISASVASAVEEQGAATGEISRNVQEAARGTEAVTRAILEVRQCAGQTGAAATQVLGSAKDLAGHSGQLGQEVAAFLRDVKTA